MNPQCSVTGGVGHWYPNFLIKQKVMWARNNIASGQFTSYCGPFMRGAVMANSSIEDLLQAANSASVVARNTWITYILFGAYLFVAVSATTPEQLLLEAPITLPLTGVKLPLRVFFQLVPWIFVLMHLYTLVQLYLLSRTLHLLNTALNGSGMIASDRERLRSRIDGFPVAQLISGGIQAWLPRQFARLATWTTLLFAPVFLLLLFQIQFLAYHDPLTTWCERLALAVDLFVIWGLWIAILHPSGRVLGAIAHWAASLAAALFHIVMQIRGFAKLIWTNGWRMPPISTPPRQAYFVQQVGRALFYLVAPPAALVLSFAVVVFSFAIATVPGEGIESSLGQTWWPTAILFSTLPDFVRGKLLHNWPARNIVLIDSDLHSVESGQPVRQTIVLRGRDLRNAILDRTNLSDADLSDADLNGASLRGANLGLATLDYTSLREALLDRAELSGARLDYAQLQGASLKGAFLRGASLFHSHMQGAQLDGAQLQGAALSNTELWGASLDAAQIQGAELTDTDLQGATLERANLEGAELTNVELSGADLRRACLWRAVANEVSKSADTEIVDILTGNADECQPRVNGKQVTIEQAVNVWSAVIPQGEIREKAVRKFESLRIIAPQDDYELYGPSSLLSNDHQWKGPEDEAALATILANLGCGWKFSFSSYDTVLSIPDLEVPVVPFTAVGLLMRLKKYSYRTYAAQTAQAMSTDCRGHECRPVTCKASEELSALQQDSLRDVARSIPIDPDRSIPVQHRYWPPARQSGYSVELLEHPSDQSASLTLR
jgi:uncharacterized protein YjbI with pentapeptide repeats